MDQLLILKLVIAYTLVGAFVFTVIVTCLSLVGWVRLADDSQQRKLFTILIVELVVGCVAWFFQFLALDPGAIAKEIGQRAVNQAKEGIEADYAKKAQQMKADADQRIKELTTALAAADGRIASLQTQVSSVDAKRAKLVADRDAAPTAAERKKLQDQIVALDREKKALVAKVDANECLMLAVPEAVIGPLVQRR